MDAPTPKSSDVLRTLEKEAITALETLEMLGKLTTEELERSGKLLRKNAEFSIQARKAGNELFTKKGHDSHIHKDILSQYSKSIAFAPKNTEESALGYSYRSAWLIHIHRYQESLVDIDRALMLTKNDVFRKKLQARKEKCLELINIKDLEESAKNLTLRNNQESFASKLINFKPSTTLPCASDCVGLAYNAKCGRHLIATKNIKPGEILIVEEAYVCYPHEKQIYIVCSYCLQIAWNGIPCDECVFTIYCSEACKNQAFQEYHDIECSMIKYIDCYAESVFDQLAVVRILIKAVRNETLECVLAEAKQKTAGKGGLESLLSGGILSTDKFKSYYNLLSYTQDVKNEDKDAHFGDSMLTYFLMKDINFLNLGQEYFGDIVSKLHVVARIKDILIEMRSILKMNAYGYQAPTDCQCENFKGYCKTKCNNKRGRFISSICSLLNHSCVANVNRIFVPKGKIIVFANSPIKRGEQLFITYGASLESTADVELRQSLLKGYHFTCKCMACRDCFQVEEESLYEASKQKLNKVRIDFYRCFSKNFDNLFLSGPEYTLILTEDFFTMVKKFSELLYQHLDSGPAYVYNVRCTRYFTVLFRKLYGERYVVPTDCK